jgi:hypothetical protein
MRGRRSILWSGIVAAACMAVGACGLFETRDPMKPPPPGAGGCRPLTAGPTSAVIPNIEDSYGRDSTVTCYSSMIDTSFAFHPDPTDSSLAPPGRYIAWNDSVEVRVNGNIATQQDFNSVGLTDKGGEIISPDSRTELRFYDYLVRISFNLSPDTLRYTGVADITFHRGADGQWRITSWVDHRGVVNDSTWGLLRGDNRF